MKGIISKVFSFFLAALLIFSFASCGEDHIEHEDFDSDGKCDICDTALEEKEPSEEGKDDGETEEKIKLIEDGVARFQIVLRADSAGSVIRAANNLVSTLGKLGVIVECVTESADNATVCEVLVGAPEHRSDAYKYDMYTLGEKGYAVKLIDGKMLIVGGSSAALVDAIKVFEEDFLGITSKTKKITDVTVKESQSIEKIQDNYRVSSLKLCGNDMRGYTIAADEEDEYSYSVAVKLRDILYSKTGYRFEIVPLSDAERSIVIRTKENTYEGDGYSVTVSEDSITFETEFPDSLERMVIDGFFTPKVTIAEGEVDFTESLSATENVRDICYEDFGAKGDGIANDFDAIYKTHEYANLWGHTVLANPKSTYYIGKTDGKSILVKTDTDFRGASFIFDDTVINPTDKERELGIFNVVSDSDIINVTDKFAHVTKENPLIDEGVTTNIGWAPGYACMIVIENSNNKQFIRYGPNRDNGASQQELIIVDKDGNIDPSTPLQWSYDAVTTAYLYSVTDRPITVGNCKVTTKSNTAPSAYTYYMRNFLINRSNMTLTNVHHTIVGEGDTGAPYQGIITVRKCANVTIESCSYPDPKTFETIGSAGVPVGMGSYVTTAAHSNNVLWKNCRQTNLRDENGNMVNRPCMGTNYCKNLYMDGCDMGTFDAHKGTYNVTLTNSEFIYVNFIGEGDIYIENVTFHAYVRGLCMVLRDDYGSTWEGELTIVNTKILTGERDKVRLISTGTYVPSHDFGYTCYLPENIRIDGLTISSPITILSLYADLNVYTGGDISTSAENGGLGGINPYISTKRVEIKNSNVVKWEFPFTPQFKDLEVFIDGERIDNWRELYGSFG